MNSKSCSESETIPRASYSESQSFALNTLFDASYLIIRKRGKWAVSRGGAFLAESSRELGGEERVASSVRVWALTCVEGFTSDEGVDDGIHSVPVHGLLVVSPVGIASWASKRITLKWIKPYKQSSS